MNKKDLADFTKIWGPANETYGKEPSDAVVMMAFSLLEKYSLDEIKKALTAHMLSSKFAPKPADIVEQIGNDWLSADEAWSIAIQTFDEARTVYVTDAINAGLFACGDIYRDGDKVGARMAFREAYNRQVVKTEEPQRFFASLGWDASGYEPAKQEAIAMGRIPVPKEIKQIESNL